MCVCVCVTVNTCAANYNLVPLIKVHGLKLESQGFIQLPVFIE